MGQINSHYVHVACVAECICMCVRVCVCASVTKLLPYIGLNR